MNPRSVALRAPSRRALAVGGLVAGLAAAILPAASPAGGQGRMVNAIVVVRPGVHLPLSVAGGHVRSVFSRIGSEFVRAPTSSLMQLGSDPRVAGVTPDRSGTVAGYKGKDDPSNAQSMFASDNLSGDAGAPNTGRGVNVAMLDTGLSDTAALSRSSGRVTDGVDVSQLDATGAAQTSGTFTDGYGHGTFLASLIAGGKAPGSGSHALGVAPAARIVVVKVANSQGETSLSEVLAGMDWVASHARGPHGEQMIQVLNVALAVQRPTAPAYGADPLTVAVEHVRATGVLVVAASGNVAGEVGDPGMDPYAATVGAADLSSPGKPSVAPFSGSGVVAGVQKPDVVASGVHVLGLVAPDSEIAQDNPQGWQDNGLFRGSGTSEATAVASGVAAAYFSDHPGSTPDQAKAALRDAATSDVKGPAAGAGLLQMTRKGNDPKSKNSTNTGVSSFDSNSWQNNAWVAPDGSDWVSLLAGSWSAGSWSAGSWSAGSWSAGSWSGATWSAGSWSARAGSWSAGSWSSRAGSWSAGSWSAGSWSAGSWSAGSWSDYGWGDR